MDNEQPTPTTTEINPAAPTDVGPADLISNATKAAERLEKANKELAKLLIMQQQMQVKKTLQGTADTGMNQVTEDEKETAEAKKMLEGTGLEDYAFPPQK